MPEALRTGSWLTRERVRLACWMLLAGSALLLALVHLTAHGLVDYQGRPLGTDFSQVWVAGRSVLAGEPAAAYDNALHWARQKAAFGPDAEFYGWLYPPMFLFPAAALAMLAYWPALLVWLGTTLSLYLAAVRALLPGRDTLLVAAAFPAVFINAGHGNNAFLTAALLGGGLALLRPRPALAGILFGLLAYKPQFGMLLPLALIAGGHWRCMAAAAVTVVLTVLATLLAFGPEPWLGFLESLSFSRHVVLEEGGAGFHRLQSAFAAVRLWGGGVGAAWLAQGVVSLAAAGLVWRSWRGSCDDRVAAAILVVGSLLATPYLFDYDLVVLAVAGACLVSHGRDHGFLDGEATLLALAWLAPLLSRNLASTLGLPLSFLTLVALLATLARLVLGPAAIPLRGRQAQPLQHVR